MPLIEPAIRKAVDEAIPKLGLVNVDSYLLEPELAWCGDGGFFKMHADTLHRDRLAHQRVMTVVYYFYKEPKTFTGGQLRVYGLGADETAAAIKRSSHNATGQCSFPRGSRMRCCLFIAAALHLRTGGSRSAVGCARIR